MNDHFYIIYALSFDLLIEEEGRNKNRNNFRLS